MDVLHARMSVHHMRAYYPWGSEEGVRSLGYGATVGCEPPYSFWKWNPNPLEPLRHLSNPKTFFVFKNISLVASYFPCSVSLSSDNTYVLCVFVSL